MHIPWHARSNEREVHVNGQSQNDGTDHLKLRGFKRISFDCWNYSVKVTGVSYGGEEERCSRDEGVGRDELGEEEDGGG